MVYIHVDDFIVGHSEENLTLAAGHCICLELRRSGFVVEFTNTRSVNKLVGLQPDGASLSPPARRLGDLDRALEWVARGDVVAPQALACILGIYIWFGLC